MDYWGPKHVELLNVMNKLNHNILCILMNYIYAYITLYRLYTSYEDWSLLRYDAVLIGNWLPIFRRTLLPPQDSLVDNYIYIFINKHGILKTNFPVAKRYFPQSYFTFFGFFLFLSFPFGKCRPSCAGLKPQRFYFV